MASVEIRGLEGVRTMLLALGDELKAAGDKAQTTLAYQIMEGEKAQMVADIDRPTPFSLGSLRYKPAGSPGLPGAPLIDGAAVYFETPYGDVPGLEPQEWLGVQVMSGATSGPRSSELDLQGLGFLRPDYVWVPDPIIALDAYGNVSGNVIKSMIDELYRLDENGQGENFFVLGGKANPKGIWAKIGGTWLPFLWFVPRAQYSESFDFHGRAERETEYAWAGIYDEAIREALARL
jgi:hypothetical protein